MELSPQWEFVSDRVMGGLSNGRLTRARIDGRDATRLTGTVSLDNNGGFVQMASDLTASGGSFDASQWRGVELEVVGNDETYEVRLRTDDLNRPWQSYRTAFPALPTWTTRRFPFGEFMPHRTDRPFDPTGLRRLGILAIGRVFEADVAVAGLRLYR